MSNDLLLGTVGDYKFPSFLVPGAAVLLNGTMDKVEAVFSAAEDAKWVNDGLLVAAQSAASAAPAAPTAPAVASAALPSAANALSVTNALGSWND